MVFYLNITRRTRKQCCRQPTDVILPYMSVLPLHQSQFFLAPCITHVRQLHKETAYCLSHTRNVWDSSVGIPSRLRAGRSGKLSDFLRGHQMILFSSSSHMAVERVQPPTQLVAGLFPGDKSTRRATDHLRPYSAEVMNAWRYTSTSPYVILAPTGHLYLYVIFLYVVMCS